MALSPSSLLGGYSEAELKAAFDAVAPSPNWKMAVSALLPASASAADLALIKFAIGFYTGSDAAFAESADGIAVTAPGYYAAVGA